MRLKACQACAAGKYSSGGSITNCSLCPAGFQCAGPTPPVTCQAGYFALEGSSGCSAVPGGFYAPTPGMSAPLPCPPGTFTPDDGSLHDECQLCPVGYFSNSSGQTACASCRAGRKHPDLWTTMRKVTSAGQVMLSYHEGAASKDFCTCDEGARLSENECVECTTGMDCPGMGEVMIKAGFYSDTDFSIFRCSRAIRCTGGLAGDTCTSGRAGIACAECLSGFIPAEDGGCKKCGGSDLIPFVVCCVMCLGFLAVSYVVVAKRGEEREGHAILMAFTSMGLLVAVSQQISIISQISVVFKEPLLGVLSIFHVLIFDIEIFNLGCIVDFTPLRRFVLKIFMIVIGAIAIVGVHALFVFFRRGGKFVQEMHVLSNVLGFFALAFYISVTSTALSPYQCKENPNQLWTAWKFESVVCWQSEVHGLMLVAGSVALLGPLAFLAYSCVAVMRYGQEMSQGNAGFLNSHRFFFGRYSSDKYWCTLFYLLRSLLLSMTPLIPNHIMQIFLAQGIWLAQLIFAVHFKPYRSDGLNFLEVDCSVCLVCLLVLCPFFAEPTPEMSTMATYIALVVVILPCIMLLFGVVVAVRRHIGQRRKQTFKFFLCHHKAGAGSFCRLLKIWLQNAPGCNGSVFIDSDNLRNLDMLFDYVGFQSETIVALVSKDLFRRPWCVGELVVAQSNSVNLIKVVFPDFEPYTKNFIDCYVQHVPDILQLAPEGIDLPMVQNMLHWMQKQKTIYLPESLSENVVADLCKHIISGQSGSISPPKPPAANLNSEVVILADQTNMQAVSTAYILSKMLTPHFAHNPVMLPKVWQEGQTVLGSLKAMLVICTNGAFEQLTFLNQLIRAEELDALPLPILSSETFRFPTGRFLQEHRPLAARLSEDPDAVLALIESVFRSIAVVFQPEHYSSTDQLLATKATEIYQRLANPTQRRPVTGTGTASLSDLGKREIVTQAGTVSNLSDAESLDSEDWSPGEVLAESVHERIRT
eukprot:TRINITY_DN16531_c0_g1_i1.p1 TRINITY_DN16531_c0_g1~~TRINITY_DN16531_c0_g1_i1.p1  ORF type:complete len:1023 (+),score=128.73 TRINITY_DN16531_c0_g1_i1:127-3069(+)